MAATQPETMVRLLQYLNISWSFNMLSKHLLWRKLLKMSWEKVTLLLREIKKQKTIPNFISRECRYHHSLPCFQQGLVCVCVSVSPNRCVCVLQVVHERHICRTNSSPGLSCKSTHYQTQPFTHRHSLCFISHALFPSCLYHSMERMTDRLGKEENKKTTTNGFQCF